MNWRDHTNKFASRVELLRPKNGEVEEVEKEFADLPAAPFSRPLPKQAHTYWIASSVAIGAYRSAVEHRFAFCESWCAGRFLVASLCTRALIELWGVAEYLLADIHQKVARSGNIEPAAKKVQRLSLGAMGRVPLPWGGFSEEDPIHVMDFVRAADRATPGTMADYDWLCNASHPTWLQHRYLSMAGPPSDNWTNPVFARRADEILDRIVKVAESAVSNHLAATKTFAESAVPIVGSSSTDEE